MKPTKITDRYWVLAMRMFGQYPRHTSRSGKWMIFLPWDQLDDAWTNIKTTTVQGYLGLAAKVSTAKPNPNAKDSKKGVIIVYTYDYSDKEDVMHIRKVLSEIGFRQQLIYKADSATKAKKYSKAGHKTGMFYA